MRTPILYVANARMPTEKAHGYQIAQMCQAFQEHGADVRLLYPDRYNPLASKDLQAYYGLRAPLLAERLPTLDWLPVAERWAVLPRLGTAASHLQTVAFAFSVVAYCRRLSPEVPVPILYLRDPNLAQLLLTLLPVRFRDRLVLELHALSEVPGRRARQARVAARTRRTVTLMGATRCILEEHGVPGDRILVEHDAVDLDTFNLSVSRVEARCKLDLPRERIIAAFVGRYHTNEQEKGIPEILGAAKGLLETYRLLDFYFIGGPIDRVPTYEKIISAYNLPRERFVFLDKRPIDEVPWFLKASDVLLMPHPWSEFYAYHVSPLKLFEYMSAQRPIVASRLPSVMEILRDEGNALLAEPGDAVSIASCIRRLLDETPLATRISAEAFRTVQTYTWNARAARILEFLSRD